jgi:hypothetical protein
MFEQSLNQLEGGHSLGDTKVVGRLAGQFIEAVAGAGSVTALLATVSRYADIFAGLDDAYTPVDGWNDARHLGAVMARRLNLALVESTADLFRAAFGVLAREVLTLIKGSVNRPDKDVQGDVEELKRYMVAILMGTVDTLYPNGKGWK